MDRFFFNNKDQTVSFHTEGVLTKVKCPCSNNLGVFMTLQSLIVRAYLAKTEKDLEHLLTVSAVEVIDILESMSPSGVSMSEKREV